MIIAIVLYNPPLDKFIGGNSFQDVHDIQKRIHEYSGINKDVYMHYITELDNAQDFIKEPEMAANSLYIGLDHLKTIGLSIPGGDSTIPETIHALSQELGYAMEKYIMNEALRQGIRFEPAYLNENFIPIQY